MPFYNKYAIPPISFNPQSRSHHLSPFEPYFDSYFELPNSIHDDNSSTLHVSVPSIPINSHDPNTMPSQPVSITPASVADIPSLLDLFNLSFASSSIAQLEFPTGIPSEMRQHLGSEFEKAIENPDTHVLKMMTGDEESFTYRERSNQKFDEEHPKDEEAGKAPVIGQDGKRTETGKGKIIACAVWEQVKGKTEQEWDEEEKKKLKEPIFYRDIELALIIRRAITPSKRRAMRQQDFWGKCLVLVAIEYYPSFSRRALLADF